MAGNLFIYHGRLGADASMRETSKGSVCELRLAADFWRENQKETHWFKVTVWRPDATLTTLKKGDEVLVFAPKWRAEAWKARDGEERETLVLTAVRVDVVSTRQTVAAPSKRPALAPEYDDEAPF